MSTCKQCNATLPNRPHRQLTFCDRSCAAKHNNVLRRSGKHCVVCNGHLPPRRKECCSKLCREKLYFSTHTDVRIESGEVSNRKTLSKYLARQFGYECSCCGLNEWRDVHLPLEVDHVDGNAGNNYPSNLRLLCGNCHSITSTWRAKNKGNGRKSRGLPLT